MQETLFIFFFTAILIWLIVLTIIIRKSIIHYNTLIHGVDNKTLPAILEMLSKDVRVSKRDIHQLIKRCDTMEVENTFHIQKVGLLRFNPFNDTGGDQSFILALVDSHNTGVVISGLYSRSGTRWYAKKVKKGRGQDHTLSDDEKRAISLAQSTA